MNLPDTHGLDLCRRIRASGLDVDIMAITAVRDVAVVRASVSLGIVQYLIKPFTFARFAEKMQGYLEFRASFGDPAALATQSDVDQTMAALRSPGRQQLDKGLAQETLDLVTGALRATDVGMSAAEVADELRLSRVTARRYLEHLVELGTVERSARYGTPGRPVLDYRWRSVPGR
jgi:response regulator of citrate/malate metabolism